MIDLSKNLIDIIIFFIGFRIIWSAVIWNVALQKNIKYGFWYGFFFGILGLLIVAVIPDKSYKEVHVIIENK